MSNTKEVHSNLCQPFIWSMAAMLRDSVVVVVVGRKRPRAILLAMITMRKSTHGFPFVTHIWDAPKLRYNCLGLTDEDNSVSRTDNFVNVNVFKHCYICSCTLLPLGFALFLNNSSRWHQNCHYLQTIHFPSWVAHSHFDSLYFALLGVGQCE